MELDAIDKLAAKAFEGYIVRKDLVRKFKGQYPVPTYVAEFLLGRYCSSIDEKEIEEVYRMIKRHAEYTRSQRAFKVLALWEQMAPKFMARRG